MVVEQVQLFDDAWNFHEEQSFSVDFSY